MLIKGTLKEGTPFKYAAIIMTASLIGNICIIAGLTYVTVRAVLAAVGHSGILD